MKNDFERFTHTFSGLKFYFLNPQPDQIDIVDIAHALSLNCRYNGHVRHFYSVAEHSVLIADLVYEVTGCKRQALSALMHDASEAYICDVPRPIKPHLRDYDGIEKTIEKAVQDKYGFDPKNELIEYYDYNIVADEAIALFDNVPEWVQHYEPIGVDILCMLPKFAEQMFLARFKKYKGE